MSDEANKTEQRAAISNPTSESSELSDESLKNVAGGTPAQAATTTASTRPTESLTLNFSKIEYK